MIAVPAVVIALVIRKLSKLELNVRDELLSSQTIRATAKRLGIKERKVRTIADHLVCLGEVRRTPGSKYPITYESPLPAHKFPEIDRGCATPDQGGADGPRPPDLSRVHLNGHIYYRILAVGERKKIVTPRGMEIGAWTTTGYPTGSVEYVGFVRMQDKDVEFHVRIGGNGNNIMMVLPRDTHQHGEGAMAKGEAILRDRATYVTQLLGLMGWQFGAQEIRGTFESGH